MTSTYDLRLVTLSIAIAILAAYTTLDLALQATSTKGKTRICWVIGSAISMGLGTWAMHFIGILAYNMPTAKSFDGLIVAISVLPAIVASAVAFSIVSRQITGMLPLILSSLLMGIGIASMHYIGMAAMQVEAIANYNLLGVAISVAIAIVASFIALWLVFKMQNPNCNHQRSHKIVGAIVMGVAISAMHYTGMKSVFFSPLELGIEFVSSSDITWLSVVVGIVTYTILGVGLIVSSKAKVLEKTASLIIVNQRLEWEIAERKQAEFALQKLNQVLEIKVEARTAQLSKAIAQLETEISDRKRVEKQLRDSETCLKQQTQELQSTLEKLQHTQATIVQTEKMSSLGHLVAGVAHEINNPVSFIFGNLSYAKQYTDDLLHLIQRYQRHYPHPNAEIQNYIQAVDLEFIIDDLPKLINSMKVGAERIQRIVMSLRSFSRMDESDMKQVNIHEGIDSALTLLQHRLNATNFRPEIQVVREYGNLPLVECYAGQINQVFMNLLCNCIDALEEDLTSGKLFVPTIGIRTDINVDNQVAIAIADNGCGIPEHVRSKLFDPFFTTKSVGKGTGMGLSISYQIITQKHGGSLNFVSAPGQGTEFTIAIPLKQLTVDS